MEKTEVVIDSKLQNNLNSLIENTLVQEQKMEEELDFFLSNTASQPKKKIVCDEKNQTLQHYQNKVKKLVDKHFVQRSEGKRFT